MQFARVMPPLVRSGASGNNSIQFYQPETSLIPSLLLPFVYTSLKSPDTETWRRLDLVLDTTLTNQVSWKASISQGSALFRIAASAFTEILSLKMIRDASLGSKELHFHHAPIFGLVCGVLGMDAETSKRAYLFVTLRDVVSAATRLILVGPMGASVMQHRIAVVAETVLEKWKDRDAGEACQTSPLLDVVQDLETHIIHVLDNTASLLLPFVYTSLKSPDTETWRRLDLLLDGTLTNQVSSKASISQGSALFRIAVSAFTEIPSLKMIRDTSLGSKELHFHHAPIFGLVCGVLGMDAETSQRAYLFVMLRGVVSAATRLNLVGPLGASVMQHRIAVVAETVLEKWKDRDAGEACQTSPLLDVVKAFLGIEHSSLRELEVV
ncbi:hypothetical protein Bca101_008724 [Brassica carinata]